MLKFPQLGTDDVDAFTYGIASVESIGRLQYVLALILDVVMLLATTLQDVTYGTVSVSVTYTLLELMMRVAGVLMFDVVPIMIRVWFAGFVWFTVKVTSLDVELE